MGCQSYVHASRNESIGMTQAWQPNKKCSLCKTVTSENVRVFLHCFLARGVGGGAGRVGGDCWDDHECFKFELCSSAA